MGNRAVITTAPYSVNNVGIYVHWNGGRASIEGFLKAAKELKLRPPGADAGYAMASLTHLIGLYFGTSGLSLGIGICKHLDTDNGDNGVYLIGGDFEIVGRKNFDGREELDNDKTETIKNQIIEKVNASKTVEAK